MDPIVYLLHNAEFKIEGYIALENNVRSCCSRRVPKRETDGDKMFSKTIKSAFIIGVLYEKT